MPLKNYQLNLGLSDELTVFINATNNSTSNLILIGCPTSKDEIFSFLSIAYPDHNVTSLDQFIEESKTTKLENINDKKKKLIFSKDSDCSTLLISILEQFSDINDREKILTNISGILVLVSLQKQCGSCAKPTVVPQIVKESFPRQLEKVIPNSYLFSRGCDKCGYSSYIGNTFLESFILLDNTLANYSLENLNPEDIFSQFRKQGNKILFESGISKIKSGGTSIEEVLKVTPVLSSAFEKLLSTNDKDNNIIESKSSSSVLIVEDDNDQREILKMVFLKEGYKVLSATNGKEALEILKEGQVSIIISDIMMPIMNGLELIKNIKSNSNLSNIPVLMLTASSNPDHEVTLLEEGADDYCAKNVKKRVLITRVEKLLRKNLTTNSRFLED